MSWVLNSADATSVYWRREEDGYVIGFNRPGIGEPSSTEDAPPADIDKYAPPVEVPTQAPGPRLITEFAFRDRFTTDENIRLELASLHNPSAPSQLQMFAARLRAAEKKLQAANFVDLDHPDTQESVPALETPLPPPLQTILAPGRAREILDAPVQEHERYMGLEGL